MSALADVVVELSVVLGATRLPIRHLLKVSRGAIVAFDCAEGDPSAVYVGDTMVARGRIVVIGDRIAIEITDVLAMGEAA